MQLNSQQQQNIRASLHTLHKFCEGNLPVSEQQIIDYIQQAPLDTPVDIKNLLLNPANYYVYPDWMPRREKVIKLYEDSVDRLKLNSDIMTMINDVEDDPHTKRDLLAIKDVILDLGYDLSHSITTIAFKPRHLVCFGTGSGHALKQLFDHFDPLILTVFVSDWKDYYSSFAEIDWLTIWNTYCTDPSRRISISQTREPTSASICLASNNLVMDHAIQFVRPFSTSVSSHVSPSFQCEVFRMLTWLIFHCFKWNFKYQKIFPYLLP